MTSSSTALILLSKGKVEHAPHECKGHHWVRELLATAFDLLCLLLVKKRQSLLSVLATWLRVSLGVASCERLQPLFGVHGWAFPSGPLQLSSEFLTRLLPAAHWPAPPRLLLLILLVWQYVACEYTFDSKLGYKIHKEHPIWHHCHKESKDWKHADNRHEHRRCGAGRVFHDRRFC